MKKHGSPLINVAVWREKARARMYFAALLYDYCAVLNINVGNWYRDAANGELFSANPLSSPDYFLIRFHRFAVHCQARKPLKRAKINTGNSYKSSLPTFLLNGVKGDYCLTFHVDKIMLTEIKFLKIR